MCTYVNNTPSISSWTFCLLVICVWTFEGLIGPWLSLGLGLGPNVTAFLICSSIVYRLVGCVKSFLLGTFVEKEIVELVKENKADLMNLAHLCLFFSLPFFFMIVNRCAFLIAFIREWIQYLPLQVLYLSHFVIKCFLFIRILKDLFLFYVYDTNM